MSDDKTDIKQQRYAAKHRRSERGNVFFTLFGAVAVVGVLGAGIMATLRGPLSTMVEVNRLEQARIEIRLATNLILVASDDESCEAPADADGFVEGVEPDNGTIVGGGILPGSVSAAKIDPWGTPYAYCSWDHGSIADAGTFDGCSPNGQAGILAGSTDTNNIAVAVISAGPDRQFQTQCHEDGSGDDYVRPDDGAGDDIVNAVSYNGAIAGSGGLWTPVGANEATISRDIDVEGTASFTGNVDLAPTAQLQLGAASLLLPTEAELTTCNTANDLLVRVNESGPIPIIELCDGDNGNFIPGGSVWSFGTGSEIFYDADNVGIGLNDPSEALDVAGNIALSGDILLINDTNIAWDRGTGTGSINYDTDTLTFTSDVDFTFNGINSFFNTDLIVNGETILNGTTADATANALTINNATLSEIFTVRNDGNVGIGDATPNDSLDVDGSTDVTEYYKIDGGTVVRTESTTPGTILLGREAGNNSTGDNNTIVGGNAAATLTTGTDNIILGEGLEPPTPTTSSYVSIGDIIHGDIGNNRVGIGFNPADVIGFNDTLEVNGTIDATGEVNAQTLSIGTSFTVDATGNFIASGDGDVDGNFEADDYTFRGNDFTPELCTAGNFNRWDGTQWVCEDDSAGGSGSGGAQDLSETLTAGNDAGALDASNFDQLGAAQICNADLSECFDPASIANGGGGLFERAGTVVRAGSAIDVTTDDFVFGSPQLADTGDATNDARFFFDKSKGAFRSGTADTTQWDLVGDNSVAFGLNSNAQGANSAAFGINTGADGDNSAAFGSNTRVNGNFSFAAGANVQANGDRSAAFGDGSFASGVRSFAAVSGNASANSSIAMGFQSTASANGAIVLGQEVQATGIQSMVIGLSDQANTDADRPQVSGAGSFGIFMDQFDNADISAEDTLGLFGGSMIINPSSAISEFSASTGGEQDLELDVEGDIGAINYCNEDGNNCIAANALAGGGGGLFENSGNVVRARSGPVNYETEDFVFGSPQLDDVTGETFDNARMFFDKSKGAFRAGTVDGAQWDDENIGGFSAAFGRNSIASGFNSFALGDNTQATSFGSIALGIDANAEADWAFAIGSEQGSFATADNSRSFGDFSTASGRNSVVWGVNTLASGVGATTWGRNSTASGDYATTWGNASVASGASATTFGQFAESTGDASLTVGLQTAGHSTRPVATGDRSAALFFDSGITDANSGYNFASSDMFGLIGGEFTIGETQVQGAQRGCIRFNEASDELEFSHDCTTYAALSGATEVPGNDREVIFNDSGALGTDTSFVFTSARRLGIGTDTPATKLEVNGGITVTEDAAGAGIYIGDTSITAEGGNFDRLTFSTPFQIALNASTSVNNVLRVSGGNNNSEKLIVAANASQTADIQQWTNSSSVPLVAVTKDGYLGIGGDTTPDSGTGGQLMLDVEGNAGAANFCDEDGNNCFDPEDIANGNTPAPGNDTEVIFNDGGVFGTDTGFAFDSSNNSLRVAGGIQSFFEGTNNSVTLQRVDNDFSRIRLGGSNDGFLQIQGAFDSPIATFFRGPRVGIGDTTPDSGTGGQLLLDVEGPIGGTHYCDENGDNCFAASDVSGSSSIWEDVAGDGSGPIRAASGTVDYATADFLFGSPVLNRPNLPEYRSRMIFDKSKGAFRASHGSASFYWDDDRIGNHSVAFGSNCLAGGTGASCLGVNGNAGGNGSFVAGEELFASNATSIAMGKRVTVTGERSLGFGLGFATFATTADRPTVSGNNSAAFFMGDQDRADLTIDNIFAIYGGRLLIDPNQNDTVAVQTNVSTGQQQLELDVTGDIGAANYCDEDGNNCFTATDVSGGSSIWEDVSGDGSGPIRAASGTVDYATADFVFGSPQQDDDTNTDHDSRMFFDKSQAAFRAGNANTADWDDSNTGLYSAAFGFSTLASGQGSFAAGEGTNATNRTASIFGLNGTASGSFGSFGMGNGVTASGGTSLAQGLAAKATNTNAIAMGRNPTASGIASIAIGDEVKATGTQNTMAVGLSDQTDTDDNRPQVSGEGSMGIFMDQADNYNLSATDQLAIIGGELMIDTDADAATGTGCIRYNDTIDALEFSNDCTTYDAIAGASGGSSVFETVANVTRAASGVADYANDDFVFGSPQLDDTGDPANYNRIFFDKSKSAFRAGAVTFTQWDDANVGDSSVAFGSQTTASGFGSMAFGEATLASGIDSTAFGLEANASGDFSTAFGQQTFSSGIGSTAFGTLTQAIGSSSTAFGSESSAFGTNSTAFGNIAVARGTNSTAFGFRTNAASFAETSLGRFSDSSLGSLDTWVDTDVLFEIGNGADNANRANALTLLKNGNLIIGGTTPSTGGEQDLRFDVEGPIGGTAYCDENGDNCFTAASVAGGSSSIWEDVASDGSGPIRAASGTVDYATADFVFGSPQLDDTGDPANYNRIFFDKSRGAFRAGQAIADQWDNTNVGDFSAAFGSNTRAIGTSSTAFGNFTGASGLASTAFGSSTFASGNNSAAFGNNTTASGASSVSFGNFTTASGPFSAAFGSGTSVFGDNSAVFGRQTIITGNNAFGFGLQSAAQSVPPTSGGERSAVFFFDGGTENANSGYDFTESDKFAIIGGEFQIGETQAQGAAKGCIRFNEASDTLEFSNDCSTYDAIAGVSGGSSVFETIANVTRAASGVADYANDDFVFGSPQLDDTSDAANDNRMFFDKSKSAFRAGTIDGAQWDEANVGQSSTAFGRNATASADYTTAWGNGTSASGIGATAWGDSSTASGQYSTAFGTNTIASSDNSFSWGETRNGGITASGRGSMAGGLADGFNLARIVSSGLGSTATGYTLHAVNGPSTIIASGDGSYAHGAAAQTTARIIASGLGSTAWGFASSFTDTIASGSGTTAFGSSIEAAGSRSLSVGLQTERHSTEPIVNGARSAVFFFDGGTENANSGYDFTESDKFAIIGGEFQIGETQAQGAAKGCIRFNEASDTLEFSNDCTTYDAIAGASGGSSVFETIANVTRAASGVADYANDDFVFGSPQLDNITNAEETATFDDTRMFFDKSKSAFRAGFAGGFQWDDANVGGGSVAFGSQTTASGFGSMAFGEATIASGTDSTAFGLDTIASGDFSTAFGQQTISSGIGSTAFGFDTDALGDNSLAIGSNGVASGNTSIALGRDVVVGTGTAGDPNGNSAVGIGLQTATQTIFPRITGNRSMALFFDSGVADANSGYNFSSSDAFALVGGEFVIGETQAQGAGRGCIRFNEVDDALEFSNDCSTYSAFGAGGTGSSLLGLSDTPSVYTGGEGLTLRVNIDGTGIEFSDSSVRTAAGAAPTGAVGINSFIDLSDTPVNFSGSRGFLLGVNSGENGLEFLDTATRVASGAAPTGIAASGITDFLELSDTPENFSGAGGFILGVNSAENGLEFLDTATRVAGGAAPTGVVVGVSDFLDLTDTPSSYAESSGFFLQVNSAGTGVTLSENIIRSAAGAAPTPASAGGGVGGSSVWSLGAGDDIYYNTGTPQVGIGNTTPDVALDVTGDIEYTGTLTDVSDRRLKTDIQHLNEQGSVLAELGKIGTYSFVMKNDKDKRVEFGVIAQEIERVFPELVRTADDEMGTKSVNYVGLIAPLIEAGKELDAQNKMLRTKIETLKAEQTMVHASIEDLRRDVQGLKAHTGYGIGKAQIGIWMLLGMVLSGFILIGFKQISLNTKTKKEF